MLIREITIKGNKNEENFIKEMNEKSNLLLIKEEEILNLLKSSHT